MIQEIEKIDNSFIDVTAFPAKPLPYSKGHICLQNLKAYEERWEEWLRDKAEAPFCNKWLCLFLNFILEIRLFHYFPFCYFRPKNRKLMNLIRENRIHRQEASVITNKPIIRRIEYRRVVRALDTINGLEEI